MEWTEIHDDTWEIPGETMKSGNAHVVPLAIQAVGILNDLRPLTDTGRYVFPSERSRERPISDNTLNAVLRRLGYSKDQVTAHGFRATARTLLAETLHQRPELIEHQLAHMVRDPLGHAYNRTQFLRERRRMMQRWADYLNGLKVAGLMESRSSHDGAVVPSDKNTSANSAIQLAGKSAT